MNHLKYHIIAFIGIWQGFFLPFVDALTSFFQFGSALLGFSIGIYTFWKTIRGDFNNKKNGKNE